MKKQLYRRLIKHLTVLLLFAFLKVNAQVEKVTPISVRQQMEKVANWQIDHFRDTYSGRKDPHHIADWTNGALYVGMSKFAKIAKDDRYWKFLKQVGEDQKWKLHWRKYMADDHTVGQMYMELYRKYGDTEMIEPTQKHFDWVIENPSKQPITLDNYKHLERWTWCDALFMAPPVFLETIAISKNVIMVKRYFGLEETDGFLED